ncbi:MAG TPA: tetratricopeptide repeat protein [Allosphingosinicella sp.]|nr:tetratricopeptide repeat protein [Allosphingosinicella sp.]
MLAGLVAVSATAASARVEPSSPLSAYVRARAAASAGALDQASERYVAALAAAPDNELIAGQALAHAVTAGDWRLALAATHILERRNAVLPDARLLLVAEAFRARDWRAAATQIDAVEHDQLFAFVVPVLRAWLAFGSGQGDPLAALPAAGGQGVAAAYAAEHRPLLMLAMGRPGAVPELVRAANSAGPRGARLRIAGAALLAQRGERAGALALLEGNGAPILAARRQIEAGRPLPGAIAGADAGMAELVVRLALDLQAQELTPLAATFARLGTWLAPDNSEAWMVAAELLSHQGRQGIAVPLLANVGPEDPFAVNVRDQRIRILLDGGDRDAALAGALAATGAASAEAGDWVRLGEVYAAMGRQADAAEAYRRALAVRREGDDAQAEWVLWLMRGGALDEAGNWPEAREALQRAYRLAPEQPFVLNYLGYAQLVRRENPSEAERLIREAHRRAPDNSAITDSLGWALYLRGNLSEAIAMLEQAAQAQPADVEINEHLGDAYFAAGRRIEARFAWKAASVYAEGAAAQRITAKIESGLTRELAAR